MVGPIHCSCKATRHGRTANGDRCWLNERNRLRSVHGVSTLWPRLTQEDFLDLYHRWLNHAKSPLIDNLPIEIYLLKHQGVWKTLKLSMLHLFHLFPTIHTAHMPLSNNVLVWRRSIKQPLLTSGTHPMATQLHTALGLSKSAEGPDGLLGWRYIGFMM